MTDAYDGWTFTHEGREFRAELHHDSEHGAPWDEGDGHGPVSDWTRRDKRPGEIILAADRGSRRFYDFREASRIAKRDGWGLAPEAVARLAARLGRTPTAGDIRHAAVMADFDHLRRWCNDDWHWCGVVVKLADDSASVWGIESDAGDYLRETALELAAELLGRVQDEDEETMAALLREALEYEAAAFDAQEEVDGADLVDWFADWRRRVAVALGVDVALVKPQHAAHESPRPDVC